MSLSLHCVMRCAYVSVDSLTLCDDSVLMSLWLFSHCVVRCAYVFVLTLRGEVRLCLCGFPHTV